MRHLGGEARLRPNVASSQPPVCGPDHTRKNGSSARHASLITTGTFLHIAMGDDATPGHLFGADGGSRLSGGDASAQCALNTAETQAIPR